MCDLILLDVGSEKMVFNETRNNAGHLVTNFDRAIDVAAHLDEMGESLFELVRQLDVAGLITPDPGENTVTYYDLYEPDDSAPIYRPEPKEDTL